VNCFKNFKPGFVIRREKDIQICYLFLKKGTFEFSDAVAAAVAPEL